ncbi:hypothetical protein [Iningainema tapete]|uniref:Uncharacterized protein n=1 Tax=Iningainema tapete BLCC-T55 TaxID=2748662 RepID=A0A8J6XTA7_9CYAN|nr:hypothetical protein [Iningainema tapete]MBD2778054.1 hypothetical protein [Iningainema tapete BLCC-T55]
MDELQCAVAYQELVEILNEFELGWLALQVADVIKGGKTVVVHQNGQKHSHLETKLYTEQEKLFLLIDAIERALVETAAMETEISEFLIAQNLEPKIIRSDGRQETVRDYSPSIVHSRKENADALKELLEKLRRDALAHVD